MYGPLKYLSKTKEADFEGSGPLFGTQPSYGTPPGPDWLSVLHVALPYCHLSDYPNQSVIKGGGLKSKGGRLLVILPTAWHTGHSSPTNQQPPHLLSNGVQPL